jgi:hypothetical protein
MKYNTIYADSLEDLQVKIIGYNHDHAHHIYFGKTSQLPENLKMYAIDKLYIFVYYEDIPI